MRVKITVSTIWTTTHPEDEKAIAELIKNTPVDVCLDYLQDAKAGDSELSYPVGTVEMVE